MNECIERSPFPDPINNQISSKIEINPILRSLSEFFNKSIQSKNGKDINFSRIES